MCAYRVHVGLLGFVGFRALTSENSGYVEGSCGR